MSIDINVNKIHEGMTHRLSVIGVPVYIVKGLADNVCKWVSCSGVEWTIQRLKALKVDILRTKSNLPPLSTFRKNRKGEIAGILGSLLRFSQRDEICFGKAVQASMIYSTFKFESLTPTQKKKFLTAISCPAPMLDKKFLSALGRAVRQNFTRRTIDRNEELSLLVYRGSPSKFKPTLMWDEWSLRDRPELSRKQDSDVLSNALYFLNPMHVPLYFEYEGLYSPILKGLTGLIDKINLSGTWYKRTSRSLIEGGEIHFLQEAGGKLRSIASPHLVHQLALRPFGKSIYKLVQSLDWDCTHDQSLPFSVLREHLSANRLIHSVDLSSATDYFPLEIQMTVLRAFFGDVPDLRLFEDISRSHWRAEGISGTLQWKRGQPLGLYPSFAAFTLSHGILLWFLNGRKHGNSFYVLGDDVVILDEDLYIKYIKILEQMGCPYSRDKSISSRKLCEFAGKIVTSTMVIPQYKWREISNDNFLDICRQMGRRSRSLLSNRQKKVFDLVQHCTVPNGLGFSYPGSNLSKMTELTDTIFRPTDKVVGSMMGLSSTIHQNVYGDKHLRNPSSLVSMDQVLQILSTFDMKVRSVLLKVLSKDLVATFLVFLKDLGGLSGVPEAVSENRDLPSLRLLSERITTLERMEKLLSLRDLR
jgi:hypothetical protein